MAELSAITQLAQPRVSTHLAKLKEAGLVMDRREGVYVYYRISSTMQDSGLEALWKVLKNSGSDPLTQSKIAPGVIWSTLVPILRPILLTKANLKQLYINLKQFMPFTAY